MIAASNGDDAAGGRRGQRATLSPELLEALCDGYGVDGAQGVLDLGGSSSLNLLLRDERRRYVVRVYRPYVTEARVADLQTARRALAAGGVPCPEAVPTRDGRPWLVLDGRVVEAERYIDHDADMDSWERLDTALPTLGRIHTILRGVAVGPDGKRPLFANHIAPQDALDRTLRGTRRIRAWGPSAAEARLADAAEALAHLLAVAEVELALALPEQLVHGDFWDNNVCFRDGRLVLVTDFDFMGERARIDDLALTLYFTSLEYAEDPVSDGQLQRLRGLVDAYDSGLDDPLTGTERAALPLAMARQPLWSIGGWVVLLDDEASARRHAVGTSWAVTWALCILRELDRWQAALG
jgi:Ser/Thr protein kinase RdoA (MazF antagonist)